MSKWNSSVLFLIALTCILSKKSTVLAETVEDLELQTSYLTLKDKDFIDETAKNNPNGYFVFFGAEWCGHCLRFKPTFGALAKKIQDGRFESTLPSFILYQVDGRDAVTSKFRVSAFPTLYFIKSNKACQYHGDRSEESLLKFFREIDPATSNQCIDYEAVYPGWIEQALDLWVEVKLQLGYEFEFYSKEYPKITYSVLAVVIFCCFIILMGLFICIKDLFTSRKPVPQVPRRTQQSSQVTSEPPAKQTQPENTGSADSAQDKKEK